MYILFIARGCPSVNDPAWGNFENEQAFALQKAGHKIIVASTDLRIRFYYRKIGITKSYYYQVLNYTIFFPLPYPLIPIRLKTIISQRLLNKLYRRIQAEHGAPKVIHAHYMNNIASAIILKKKYKIPVVGTEHWSKLTKDKLSNSLKYLGKVAYQYTDLLITVSQSASKKIANHFSIKSEVIPNMFDIEHFQYQSEKSYKSNEFIFISVGSIIPRKGYDLLIRAFAKANFGDDVILRIIGKGKNRKQIQELIDENNLSNNVYLMGSKTKEEIAILMQQSDAFVLASRAETFGVVFIEAMASGLPVIGTSCGGPEEFINQSNGIVVPVNDVTSLTMALEEMYTNINRYDRKKIALECKQSFSSEKIVKNLERVYNEVLKNK